MRPAAAMVGAWGQARRPGLLLPACLLLLVAEAPGHGYELSARLRDLGIPVATGGSVYRHLRCLERAGLLRSEVEFPESGPSRTVYRVTAAGRQVVDGCCGNACNLPALLAHLLAR